MPDLTAVCVYCGSSSGDQPAYAEAAVVVGQTLASEGITLVYGGSALGLMGILADAALGAGGDVIGVMPKGVFRREIGHAGLTELVEVDSMHQRKQRMFELSDAFVGLPGGMGTLEELTEIASWAQLGLHRKPVATLNVAGYWSSFHAFLEQAVTSGFMKSENLSLIANVTDVSALLPTLRSYQVAYTDKWIGLDET
jgi:uncharacterized protein (TIGR00730 family)